MCRCSFVVSAVVGAALEALGGQEGVPNSTHGDEIVLNSFTSRGLRSSPINTHYLRPKKREREREKKRKREKERKEGRKGGREGGEVEGKRKKGRKKSLEVDLVSGTVESRHFNNCIRNLSPHP